MEKKRDYFGKTTINLAYKEREKGNDPKVVIPLAVVILVAVALFSKYMVTDRLQEAMRVNAQLNEIVQQTEDFRERNKEFDEVKEEYSRSSTAIYHTEELLQVDMMDVLDIVDNRLLREADINTCVFDSNVLNLVLTEASLRDVAAIVSGLYESPLVTGVTVSVATTEGQDPSPDKKAATTISITLSLPAGNMPGGDVQ